jgi:glycosyltransferase involved in cell wall biosynthesis
MRIVHINRSDTTGGAAVAAMRLVKALNENDVTANMLVAEKNSDLPWVQSIVENRFDKAKLFLKFAKDVAAYIPHEKHKATRFAWSVGQSGFDISKHPLVQQADIIHLHWINQGFISTKGLSKLLKLGKPVVWTLHDMWSFTGGCHYSADCTNYTEHCGSCPFLNDAAPDDISYDQHQRKSAIYKNANLHFVTCSNWLGGLAQKASLLKHKSIISISNPIETDIYSPQPKDAARERLGLSKDKKIILFGAANISDPRKGMPHLLAALNHLAKKIEKNQIELLVFGKAPAALTENFPYPVRLLNYISNQQTLVDLYNAADVFVLPSLEDNLPNTVMEALSCGLPVAAFRIGGVPEMVINGSCGYLSKSGDSIGLSNSIEKLLFDENHQNFGANARQKVEESYAPTLIAQKYIDLYTSILKK